MTDMLVGLRLDINNYDSWHHRIKYLLNESDLIDFINREVVAREKSAAEMQRHSTEITKDQSLSCLANDIVHQFEHINSTKAERPCRRGTKSCRQCCSKPVPQKSY